jgi:hypothetical protein
MKRRRLGTIKNAEAAREIINADLKGLFSLICINNGLTPVFDCIPEGVDEETIIFGTDEDFIIEFQKRLINREAKLSEYLLFMVDKRETYLTFGTI